MNDVSRRGSVLSLPKGRQQYLNEQMRRAGRVSVMAQVQCLPQRGGDGIGFTNSGQNLAAMKSDKPSLRLAASPTPDNIGGLDDNARFAHVVMPYIDDAYRLAHWLTGNSSDHSRIRWRQCSRVAAEHRTQHRLFLAAQEPPDYSRYCR